jgi:hypothetical protein
MRRRPCGAVFVQGPRLLRLVDGVLPRVPVRQWVLSLPRPLRYRLAYDAGLASVVLAVFLRAVFAWLRRRAKRAGIAGGQPGAVTFLQRFGSAINIPLHARRPPAIGSNSRSEPHGPSCGPRLGARTARKKLRHGRLRDLDLKAQVTELADQAAGGPGPFGAVKVVSAEVAVVDVVADQ